MAGTGVGEGYLERNRKMGRPLSPSLKLLAAQLVFGGFPDCIAVNTRLPPSLLPRPALTLCGCSPLGTASVGLSSRLVSV